MDLVVRAPAESDFEAVADLVHAKDVADFAEADDPESIRIDLRQSWGQRRFDLASDAWVVVAGRQVVAYADVSAVRAATALVNPNSGVHPAFRRRGIGSRLVQLAEDRARDLDPTLERIRSIATGANPGTSALYQRRGYAEVERSWQMTAELDGPPPPPRWPEHIRLRTWRRGEDARGLYELIASAFADNDGYDGSGNTFEAWESWSFTDDTDCSLYFVVEEEGGELVGCALCQWYPDIGWIRQVAVRRDHRGRGLGTALLRHAFGELNRRGHRRVGLVVDSWNTTGAKRLYKKLGMRETLEHVKFEKTL